MTYPTLIHVKRSFESPTLADPKDALHVEWQRSALSRRINVGDSVAITVGSRGIHDIVRMVKLLGQIICAEGGQPFVVPTMGSHGGATAEGQAAVLAKIGITETSVGMPIKSSMEVKEIGTIGGDYPVYLDRHALQADHILIVGRIKPHTDFAGEVQSGLMKMMAIGLGKHAGALVCHTAFLKMGFENTLRAMGECILSSGKILGGIAILENHSHQTAHIEVIKPKHFLTREPQLLSLARQWMPDLPFKNIDLLIVDEMGKEISGTGMDSNVIGRKHLIHGVQSPDAPSVRRIYVRDLTDDSNGNATGIGLADYTHTRLYNKIDRVTTYNNCNTAANPRSASIPMYFDSDRAAIDAAIQTIGVIRPLDAKIVWVQNTLDLDTFWVSPAYRNEVMERADMKIINAEKPFQFDQAGNLHMV